MTKRNPIAKALRSPHLRQRKIPSKRKEKTHMTEKDPTPPKLDSLQRCECEGVVVIHQEVDDDGVWRDYCVECGYRLHDDDD